jgi:hypothetical protein
VNRLGAGRLWVSPSSVLVELAPSESPSGGILAIDAVSGFERWQLDDVDEIFWTGADQIVTSTAAAEFRGSQAWDLIGVDVATGETQWELPVSAPASQSVVGVADSRAVVVDPHPAVAGVSRIRLIDAADGSVVWETSSVESIDGASIEVGSIVTVHRTTDTLVGERGFAALIISPNSSWGVTQPDGVEQAPILTPHGLFVVSGETSAVCIGRELHTPGRTPLADEAEVGVSSG